ncbi:hypothetical protein, partial [Escherichia coli]|uniref:hypothetical protein n=1 Tax=Escherichia coli TaxID=562 RepID=UPI0020255734
ADTLQQSGGEDGGSVVFPPVLVQMLDRLESEILADRVSEESCRWLASCGLTVEQMQNQMDPVYTPARKIHLYHFWPLNHSPHPPRSACHHKSPLTLKKKK